MQENKKQSSRQHIGRLVFCLSAILVFALPAADAKTYRSYAAKAEFKRANPCPANGKQRGPCPGYVVDHIEPLCAGGVDEKINMQWQTVAEGKRKDRDEIAFCLHMRRSQRHSPSPIK